MEDSKSSLLRKKNPIDPRRVGVGQDGILPDRVSAMSGAGLSSRQDAILDAILPHLLPRRSRPHGPDTRRAVGPRAFLYLREFAIIRCQRRESTASRCSLSDVFSERSSRL